VLGVCGLLASQFVRPWFTGFWQTPGHLMFVIVRRLGDRALDQALVQKKASQSTVYRSKVAN
jgi:hypothetical protein